MRVLVYGTLKRGNSNNRCLRGAAFIREDKVPGYMLKDSGFPAALPDENSMITGEVWDIGNPNESAEARGILAQCDMLEGYDAHHPGKEHNRFYYRQETVTLTGEHVHMYVGHEDSFGDNEDMPFIEDNGVKVYSWHR